MITHFSINLFIYMANQERLLNFTFISFVLQFFFFLSSLQIDSFAVQSRLRKFFFFPSSFFSFPGQIRAAEREEMDDRSFTWRGTRAGPGAYHAELISCCLALNALENAICIKALIC